MGSNVNPNPSGTPVQYTHSNEQAAVDRVTSLQAQLSGEIDTLSALMRDLAQIAAERPASPGPDADDKAKAAYAQALGRWQQQLAHAQGRINAQYKKIADTESNLRSAEAAIGPARSQDESINRRNEENARKMAEAEAELFKATATTTEDKNDNRADLAAQIKKEESGEKRLDLTIMLRASDMAVAQEGQAILNAQHGGNPTNLFGSSIPIAAWGSQQQAASFVTGGGPRDDGLTI